MYYEVNVLNGSRLLMSFREETKAAALRLKRSIAGDGFDTEILELSDGPLFDSVAEVVESNDERWY